MRLAYLLVAPVDGVFVARSQPAVREGVDGGEDDGLPVAGERVAEELGDRRVTGEGEEDRRIPG